MSESGFAELLRELKNRSGHSYGTLAKRLHMSTSTLHRYCNGDAVPADYAPVERLARLCRATPEELVELHRRWVLADAWRGRKEPSPPAVTEPEPVSAAEPEPVSAAEAVPGPVPKPEPVPAAKPESVSAAEAVPGPVAEPESVPVAGPESVSAAESVPVPKAGPEPVSAAERPRPVSEAAPGAPRRRGRRPVALLAALTVTALLGTVAVALNLPSGHSGDAQRDGRDGRNTAATWEAAAGDSASPVPTAGSPVPHRSATRSPSRSASPSPKAPAAHGGTPADGPAAATTERTTAGPPLTVTTHPFSWQSPCSQHYLIDRPPTAVAPPPLEQDAPAWVDVHQAVSAGEQFVTFTVQGTGGETVVLEKLSVRMAGKRSPLAWNDYAMGYPGVGCGGDVPTRSFTVALDALRPAPLPEAGNRNFPFKVSRSDPEVFHVTADASAYDVSWYLELSWSSGDRHGTLVIDDAGRPFRTSGNNGRPAYAFPLGGEKWRPASEAN
ncbi:transcriptional regulator [Streptomyces sp. Ru62]|uniref:helix-turn-helix domain-containing protein n=1 Tax=Streptomyces sp. Ru62 TaxID=2080745 RepID=UPI000CDCF968|nr:helix-turn-helix domain-containing protein [Streptomyces sp. Ru62]POX57715.1 transcriptional regulator [Streptomyces sp. Ru62]